MPQRTASPFLDSTENLDPDVNRFVSKLVEAQKTGCIPAFHGPALKDKKGRWLEVFEKLNPDTKFEKLVVEIGCHKGRTILDLAKQHPDVAFIGMDITYKRVVMTAERAKSRGLSNVVIVLANAKFLPELFSTDEVSGFIVFFPDPWVKKKSQAKNRLLTLDFCREMESILPPSGFFSFKTDQKPYFDEVCGHIDALSLEKKDGDGAINPNEYGSSFEDRFHEKGLPTFGAFWVKPPS